MRFWDLSSPEVAAADAEPWDGPLSGAMRPLSMRTLIRVYAGAIILAGQAGLVALVLSVLLSDELVHPTLLWWLGWVVLAYAAGTGAVLAVVPPRTWRHLSPLIGIASILAMGVITSLALWWSGPTFGVVMVFYFEALPFAFYTFYFRWALVAAANAATGCGLVLMLQDGWAQPGATWLVAASTMIAVAWITGIFAERSDRLAESEHEARLELAELNRTLEDQVTAQVTEIEQLGGLRRFLSPQVADAVLSADADQLTGPHRARIAVFFCDLRGFTAFTKESEPEEVITDLDQYYRTVGEVLQRHEATIGGYAGDGIMAYLGDPVPHAEPARGAVRMVTELRGELDGLVDEWQRRGHDLSYGVGLAYGYATLGVVGFDGRYDYTPMGGVVNLAARLCGEAAAGQVLLDHATYAELHGEVRCDAVFGIELKGLGAQRAYALA